MADITSAATGFSSSTGIFGKLRKKVEPKKTDEGPVIPAVPIGAITAGFSRLKGRGTRDTILNGADGVTS
jgi:hypothetical protein